MLSGDMEPCSLLGFLRRLADENKRAHLELKPQVAPKAWCRLARLPGYLPARELSHLLCPWTAEPPRALVCLSQPLWYFGVHLRSAKDLQPMITVSREHHKAPRKGKCFNLSSPSVKRDLLAQAITSQWIGQPCTCGIHQSQKGRSSSSPTMGGRLRRT